MTPSGPGTYAFMGKRNAIDEAARSRSPRYPTCIDVGSIASIALTPKGIIVGGDGSPYEPCPAARCGVVFADNPATGQFGVLATFAGYNGTEPMVGGVTPDNVIYGAAEGGGPGKEGTLFEIVQVGGRFKINVLYALNGTSSGELPSGGPALAADGALIGTTSYSAGGEEGGTLYSFANGVFTTLYTFTTTDSEGWQPQATPLITPAGLVIGANENGGDTTCAALSSPFNCGALYSYTR